MIRLDHLPDAMAIANPPESFNPKTDHVIARLNAEGKLLGGVTFQNFLGGSIALHVNSFDRHWLTRDFLWVIFHYPFVQLGCKKVMGFVPSSNQKALEFDKHIGFKEEYRISDACVDGDLVVLSMRREECRWLKIQPKGIRSRGKQ